MVVLVHLVSDQITYCHNDLSIIYLHIHHLVIGSGNLDHSYNRNIVLKKTMKLYLEFGENLVLRISNGHVSVLCLTITKQIHILFTVSTFSRIILQKVLTFPCSGLTDIKVLALIEECLAANNL